MTRANQISEWIAKRGTRSTLLVILVNLCLSVTKISAGMVVHSFALLADGLESGADVLSGPFREIRPGLATLGCQDEHETSSRRPAQAMAFCLKNDPKP